MGICSSIPEPQTIRDEIREIEHRRIKPPERPLTTPTKEPPDFQWVT